MMHQSISMDESSLEGEAGQAISGVPRVGKRLPNQKQSP
jgi:hypothetical protein